MISPARTTKQEMATGSPELRQLAALERLSRATTLHTLNTLATLRLPSGHLSALHAAADTPPLINEPTRELRWLNLSTRISAPFAPRRLRRNILGSDMKSPFIYQSRDGHVLLMVLGSWMTMGCRAVHFVPILHQTMRISKTTTIRPVASVHSKIDLLTARIT